MQCFAEYPDSMMRDGTKAVDVPGRARELGRRMRDGKGGARGRRMRVRHRSEFHVKPAASSFT
jgi:hypothetical protein